MPVPEDFKPHFRKSPVTEPWEPLFSRVREGGVDLLFEVRPAHCNSRGILHGGVLAALCDNAMGLSLGLSMRQEAPQLVTVTLVVDFIGSARLGATVLIEPRVIRVGGGVGFCDALVRSEDVTLGRASGTFRVRPGRPEGGQAEA